MKQDNDTPQKKILCPDICIIGAGAAGLTIAAGAAAFGQNVVLVEKGAMGGDCLNYGCVPSKAMLAVAHIVAECKRGDQLGVHASAVQVEYEAVHAHIQSAIAQIAPHDSQERFEKLGVMVLREAAYFRTPTQLMAGDVTIKAKRFVIATGSSPSIPAIKGLEEQPYLTNETIFSLNQCPAHLIIIGGGVIALELGQAQRRLGAELTIIEAKEPLANFEQDLKQPLMEQLESEGVVILTGHSVTGISKCLDDNDEHVGVRVHAQSAQGEMRSIKGSHLLVAAGRKPAIHGLELEAAGIALNGGAIAVDHRFRTTNSRVYALGDVNGISQFTHSAGAQASMLLRHLLFSLPISHHKMLVPQVVYTDPPLAKAGLSLQEARQKYKKDCKQLQTSFSKCDRAVASGKTNGFLRLIVNKRGQLLGAQAVGENAGELIGLLSKSIARKEKLSSLLAYTFPYPSWNEIIAKTAIDFYRDYPSKTWVRWLVRVLRFLR
ncbi:dihydrolipoyl dehydrogenase family protein [Polycladidibacter stylochi]|uniref:dihydrolipoyl dehydrogenase family protein n=1 Tax=Polycladidibacter stylochi TaxID=1807766 RepID=UPI000832CCE7|nr:FAD-dependent oxidoreductase [Pseudovibrio stylochi]